MHGRLRGNDRRRFERLNINLAAWYKVTNPTSALYNQETEVKLVDLSQGGMACLTSHNIPAKTPLFIKFVLFKVDRHGYLKFHGPLKVTGEVCSNNQSESNQYRLGVAFKEVCRDDESCIADFVGSTFVMP